MSVVKSLFSIGLLSCDLIGLHIDVMKCTVPCTEESCCQMGAREAVVLLHGKKKKPFLSCPNSAVNISRRCSASKN